MSQLVEYTFWEGIGLLVRWTHALVAALWVGGGLLYIVAVKPGLNDESFLRNKNVYRNVHANVGKAFSGSLGVFLLTGAILTAQRLAHPDVSAQYILVLLGKILLSGVVFGLVWNRGELFTGWKLTAMSSLLPRQFRSKGGLAVVIGSMVYLISSVLHRIVELTFRAS